MLDAEPEHDENADNVETDGVIIGFGVHINVNPDAGNAVFLNFKISDVVVPADVAVPQPTTVVSFLLLKSVFEVPLKPTIGCNVVEVVTVIGAVGFPYTIRITPVDLFIRI